MQTFVLIILLIILIIDFTIAFFAGILISTIILYAYSFHAYPLKKKLYRELHASRGCIWNDDATVSMQRIHSFLFDRKERLSGKPSDFHLWKIPSDSIHNAVFFVRMCHVLGCEVVIRRVADHDIEEDPDNSELVNVRNKVQKKRV